MTLRVKLGFIAALLLSLAGMLCAEPVAKLRPTGYVNDFAHVLNPATSAQMEELCRQVDEAAHAQIAVVTVPSLDGVDIESYAVDLFSKWGIGAKATNRGVLILYAIQDHQARIEVGYGLEPILPDGKVGGFQREAVPQMRSGDYSGALLLVTSHVASVIAQDAGIQLSHVPADLPQEPVYRPAPHLSLGGIIALVVLFIVIMCTPLRGILFWILLSQLGGGGGGGFGVGGFGGGGGFGGFGGGSSGGGGASSSW